MPKPHLYRVNGRWWVRNTWTSPLGMMLRAHWYSTKHSTTTWTGPT